LKTECLLININTKKHESLLAHYAPSKVFTVLKI